VQPGWVRLKPPSRASAASAGSAGQGRTRPVGEAEDETRSADADLVPFRQIGGSRQPAPLEERPVLAPEVLEPGGPPLHEDARVPPRHPARVDPQGAAFVATDGGGRPGSASATGYLP